MLSLSDLLASMKDLDTKDEQTLRGFCLDAVSHILRLQSERDVFERRMLVAESSLTQQTTTYMSVQELREHDKMMKNLREGGI